MFLERCPPAGHCISFQPARVPSTNLNQLRRWLKIEIINRFRRCQVLLQFFLLFIEVLFVGKGLHIYIPRSD